MCNVIRQGRFNVLLTTYEYVIKDKATLAKVSSRNNLTLIVELVSYHLTNASCHMMPHMIIASYYMIS